MKFKSFALLGCVLLTPSLSFAGTIVKNIFNSGDTISSSKMNANFAALESATNGALANLSRTVRSASSNYNTGNSVTSAVLSKTCNNDEIMVGGTCSCTGDPTVPFNSSTTNFGVLSACSMSGNGIIGYCYSDWTQSSYKYGSPISIYAACVKGTTVASAISSSLMVTKSSDEPQEPDQELLDEIEKANEIIKEIVLQRESN